MLSARQNNRNIYMTRVASGWPARKLPRLEHILSPEQPIPRPVSGSMLGIHDTLGGIGFLAFYVNLCEKDCFSYGNVG